MFIGHLHVSSREMPVGSFVCVLIGMFGGLVLIDFLHLHDPVQRGSIFPGIYPFLLGSPFVRYRIIRSILLQSFPL